MSGQYAFSQEICDNGIDDDSDGLIDLNDTTDCFCAGSSSSIDTSLIPSFIPNPSFEDTAWCPSSFSQMFAVDSWVRAGPGTSDYMNTCGYVQPAVVNAGLLPFPDGDGIAGFFANDGYWEYIGSCLNSPLIAGTEYTLVFNIGAIMQTGPGGCGSSVIDFGPLDFTIFGSTSCADLPFSNFGCPVAPWQAIGVATYTPTNSWSTITLSFTPTQNINAVVVGPPCTFTSLGYEHDLDGCWPYFVVDNFIMNETSLFNSSGVLSTEDSICAGDPATLTVTTSDTAATYVWTDNFGGGPYGDSSSIIVNPMLNTSYSVIITGGYCNDTLIIPVTIDPNCSPLPIELVSFEADCEGDDVLISWSTASEKDNDYFTIEKSSDGVLFESIGIVEGAGNSSNLINYSFIDDSRMTQTSYYRVKQTDFDGQFTYSSISAINCSSVDDVSIYPNPFSNSFTIDIGAGLSGPIEISIVDNIGRLVHNQTIKTKSEHIKLSVGSELSTGVYFVKVNFGTEYLVEKLTKLN